LLRVYRGVYQARSAPSSFEQTVLAATLASAGLASHGTAAKLLGLSDEPPDAVHVVVPATNGRRVPGVRVHRASLKVAERSKVGAVPVTSVGRTLVDIAGSERERTLAVAVDRALGRRSTTIERLRPTVEDERFDRRRGIHILRRIVSDRYAYGASESVLEVDMIELLREFGLPAPRRQLRARVNGRSVRFDLAYEEPLLAIELDGRIPHTDLETWQRDHDRHNAVALGGVPVVRFTWHDVHERRVYVACTVAAALGLRPASWKRTVRHSS
jgi:very-short-patch-repair endonuclease